MVPTCNNTNKNNVCFHSFSKKKLFLCRFQAAPDIPIKPKSNDQGTLCALLTRGMSCLENFCDDEDEDEENQDENPNEKKEGDPSLP